MSSKPPTKRPYPTITHYPTETQRYIYKNYNSLSNSLYPVPPWLYASSTVAVGALLYAKKDHINLLEGLSVSAQNSLIAAASVATSTLPVVLLRTFLKRFYFSYKRMLFENPKKPSLATKLWAVVRHALARTRPSFLACDGLLPSPSVPNVEETVRRYLGTMKQLHSKDEFEEITRMAEDFLANEAASLNRMARIWSLFPDNYVTPLWEKYAYLYGRDCLLVNSSVAHLDQTQAPAATQAVRAARIIYYEILGQLCIDKETYKPPGGGLVCTRHYDKLYAVARIPGEHIDYWDNYGISRHLIVIYKGNMYKLNFIHEKDNRICTVSELTDMFVEIIKRGQESTDSKICALTHDKRNIWHFNRQRFFLNNAVNKEALKAIESAMLVLDLSDDEYSYSVDDTSRFMRDMITGNGSNRWVDKSLNYTITRNGRGGGTEEHSIADGSEFDHLMEHSICMDWQTPYPSLEDQVAYESQVTTEAIKSRGVPLAERLHFDISDDMASEIQRCYDEYAPRRDDLEIATSLFTDFGKGRLKKCGVSPDGFIQMALQLATYRDQGKFVLTYEATSARFYANSRTETLRTVTAQSCEFVRAMDDASVERATRAQLLKAASEKHAAHNRLCITNQGVDRHLFVLFVMAQGRGISSPFLEHYVQQEWLLSTSQLPNMTNSVPEDEHPEMSWIGGGFAPVAKTGYGVCYRLAGNHSIHTHISSFLSAENTDSKRFRAHFERAMKEMSELFD